MYTNERLRELLAMSLEDKIQLSKLRIIEFAEHYKGNVVVSFSGGKDSTVLLHLVRQVYPEIKAVYCDTGLEFPEVKEFVKTQKNVEIIRPVMSFNEVVNKYGWVFPSKETAQKIYYAKRGRPWALNHMNGLDNEGNPSKFKKRFKKYKYLVDCDIKISSVCCDIMKKKPFHDYLKNNGGGMFVGTMTEESALRKQGWLRTGCNAFALAKGTPLSFWTEQDVYQYIVNNGIEIAKCYGKIIYEAGKYKTTGEKRTGCMFCPIGVQLEKQPNKFQRMAITYPKIWNYVINRMNLRKLLDYAAVPYAPKFGGNEL